MPTVPGPGIVATVCAPDDLAWIDAAGACEIRADLWPGGPSEAIRAIGSCRKPVVFTCRIAAEGGRFAGAETERDALFGRALEAGAALVDVEAACGLFARAVSRDWPVVASVHDFTGMFDNMGDRIAGLGGSGARAAKVVPTATSFRDLLVVRAALAGASKGTPAICFAMGDHGLPSRILALAWGSHFTYAAATRPVAPGQPTVADLIGTYRSLNTTARHVAFTARPPLQADLLANVIRFASDLAPCAGACVPYQGASLADLPALFSLGAWAVVELSSSGAGLAMDAYAPGSTDPAATARAVDETQLAAGIERVLEAVR